MPLLYTRNIYVHSKYKNVDPYEQCVWLLHTVIITRRCSDKFCVLRGKTPHTWCLGWHHHGTLGAIILSTASLHSYCSIYCTNAWHASIQSLVMNAVRVRLANTWTNQDRQLANLVVQEHGSTSQEGTKKKIVTNVALARFQTQLRQRMWVLAMNAQPVCRAFSLL